MAAVTEQLREVQEQYKVTVYPQKQPICYYSKLCNVTHQMLFGQYQEARERAAQLEKEKQQRSSLNAGQKQVGYSLHTD